MRRRSIRWHTRHTPHSDSRLGTLDTVPVCLAGPWSRGQSQNASAECSSAELLTEDPESSAAFPEVHSRFSIVGEAVPCS